MERKILFLPAWDRTDPDPSKNYGVSCLHIKFHLIGESGVVEFDLLTQWYQPHVMDRRFEDLKQMVWRGEKDSLIRHLYVDPNPIDICRFSLNRLSEDDTHFERGVSYVFDGAPCYYDYKTWEGEGMEVWAHDYAMKLLVEEGDEALWQYLEKYYHEEFGEKG